MITAKEFLHELEHRLDIKTAGDKLLFQFAGQEFRNNVKVKLQEVLKELQNGAKDEMV